MKKHHLKVLIIDNSYSTIYTIHQMIQTDAGTNELKTVDNAEDALLLLQKYQPDVIISAIDLLNNYNSNLLKYLQEKQLSSKCIFLSNQTDDKLNLISDLYNCGLIINKKTQLPYLRNIVYQLAA